ncbi:TIR domain-containing protein (plasmid) [Rhizobium leguminosarum]
MSRDDVEILYASAGTIAGTNASKPPTVGRPVPDDWRYEVFLCHNQNDKPWVKDIADALQLEAGLLFFLDEYSIPGSAEFLEFIKREMRRSRSCAIFLGENGWGPTHIEEARLALDIRAMRPEFRIIPVKLPGARDADWTALTGDGRALPFNWVEFKAHGDTDALAKLTAAVQGNFETVAKGPDEITPYYLRRQAALWEKSNRSENSLLIRGKLLKEALRVADANPSFVTVNAVPAYLARCGKAERDRLKVWLGLAVAALVIAGVLIGVTIYQKLVAEREARISLVRSLVTNAPHAIGNDRNDERAALLARQAFNIDKRDGSPSGNLVDSALSDVLATPYFSSVFALPGEAWPDGVSSTGNYFLSGGDGQFLLTGPVLNPQGRRSLDTLSTTIDAAAATFRAQSDDLLVAEKDGSIKLRSPGKPDQSAHLIVKIDKSPAILASSGDGRRGVGVIDDRRLVLFDITENRVLSDWLGDTKINAVDISYDGSSVATSDNESGQLRVYRPGSGTPFAIYPGDEPVNSFQFTPNGSILVGSRYGHVTLWNPLSNDGPQQIDTGDRDGSVDAIAQSPKGMLFATASGASALGISLWNPNSDPKLQGIIPGVRAVILLSFTSDGRFLISATTAGDIRYWRVGGTGTRMEVSARSKQPFPIPGKLYSIRRFPGSDSFIVGGDHGVLQMWPSTSLNDNPLILADKRTAALSQLPDRQRSVFGSQDDMKADHVMAVAISQNGRRFATVDPYGNAMVWNRDTLDEVPKDVVSTPVASPALSVALSPSGNRLAVGINSSLTFVHTLDKDGNSVNETALPSDGTDTVRDLQFIDEDHLLVGDDHGRLAAWSLGNNPTKQVIFDSGPMIGALAVLDTNRFVVGRGDRLEIVDLSNKGTTITPGAFDTVISVAVSDDLKKIAAGYSDGTIRVWSSTNLAAPPTVLAVHRDYVHSLAFSRDGNVILSVSYDGMIDRSVVDRDDLSKTACDVVWRDLDANEQIEFFGDTKVRFPTCEDFRSNN